MTRIASNVVPLHKSAPRRQEKKSQWELYPLPFFKLKTRSLWDVKPTGDYGKDCETGKAYAIEFLNSCDGTACWAHLLPQMVGDMIRAGPVNKDASGGSYPGGIIVAFMLEIGFQLAGRLPIR
jgi:hypothetical protein